MPVPTNVDTGSGASAQPTERKSQKQMTKAERRELQEQQRAAKLAQKSATGNQTGGSAQGGPSQPKPVQKPPTSGQSKGGPQAGVSQPSSNRPRSMSIRDVNAQGAITDAETDGRPVSRGLRIFHHFGLPKHIHSIKGDIHPAIIRLGLLFSEFKICGANARCIATLTAFKTVIQDYTTPPHNTLSRHLMTHLSPQITYLVSARPMSVTMGNAIRQLKLEISNSDIDMVEQDAKNELCTKIDSYIQDRIIVADEVIQELAGKKIKDGDVVLTYARSSIVEKILLNAAEEGIQFSVIVVDSRPLLEGKTLLKTLINAEIPCTYALLSALPSLISEVSTVLIGAHSLNANGSVYSRAGTALVAMMAKAYSVPVMVCCETYKFSEGVMLDGFGKNEIVPARFTKSSGNPQELMPNSNLEILNPLYDLTPPSCITAVVTEVGLIPPSSISSIPLALGKTNL